jgi:hypothetical protein
MLTLLTNLNYDVIYGAIYSHSFLTVFKSIAFRFISLRLHLLKLDQANIALLTALLGFKRRACMVWKMFIMIN